MTTPQQHKREQGGMTPWNMTKSSPTTLLQCMTYTTWGCLKHVMSPFYAVQYTQRPLGVMENDNVCDPTPTPCNHLHVLTITSPVGLAHSVCVIPHAAFGLVVDLCHKCQNNVEQSWCCPQSPHPFFIYYAITGYTTFNLAVYAHWLY